MPFNVNEIIYILKDIHSRQFINFVKIIRKKFWPMIHSIIEISEEKCFKIEYYNNGNLNTFLITKI